MTDAREWLDELKAQARPAEKYTADEYVVILCAALLAVLDKCDRMNHDAEQMLYRFGPGDYYMGQRMGLMTAVSDVRRAIDTALGVTDD